MIHGSEKAGESSSGMNPLSDDETFARLAIKQHLLDEERLQEVFAVLKQERELGHNRTLEEVLVAQGTISEKQRSSLQMAAMFLKNMEPERLFARIVVKNRLASQDQVDEAMRQQAKIFKETKSFKTLGDILVEANIMTARQHNAVRDAVERIKRPKQADSTQHPQDIPSPAHVGARTAQSPRGNDANQEDAETLKKVICEYEYYDILVSEDKMAAYLLLKREVPEDVGPEEVIAALSAEGISYGIAGGEFIEQYLREKPDERSFRKIARGLRPEKGKDAEIRILFSTGPQDSRATDEKGVVDFKDRGEIPQVKKGDIIAEKSLRTLTVEGVDVYGNTVLPEETKDTKLIGGPGTEKSPDGLKLYAEIDGRPQISPFGAISILPELTIEGDVNFETGNITFEGNVDVRGVIQDGFAVKARALTAREISKAHIEVNGDITVSGGILGATIKGHGHIRAVHIHASAIETLGDVIVERGIFESRVVTSGKCLAPNGKIIASKISAKQGIEAAQIGSDRTEPCALAVGVDRVSEREIETLKNAMSLKKQEMVKYRTLVDALNAQTQKWEFRIGELAQVQDRSSIEQRILHRKREALRKDNNAEELSKTEAQLLELQSKIKSAETELEHLFDQQDQARDNSSDHLQKIAELQAEAEDLDGELSAFVEWTSSQSVRPIVKVFDTIYSGTTIKGPCTSLLMESDSRKVLIREDKSSPSDSDCSSVSKRKMRVYNLS